MSLRAGEGADVTGSVEGSSRRHPDFNRPDQGSFLILWRSLLSQMRTVQSPGEAQETLMFQSSRFSSPPGAITVYGSSPPPSPVGP